MDLIPRSWTAAPETTTSSSPAKLIDITGGVYSNLTSTLTSDGTRQFIVGEDELFQGYSDELLTFASVICIIFTLIGIPGNLITIIAISKCHKARSATAIFIINLSVSDLLFCCFNLPLAASTFLQRSWNHGDLLCRLFPLMRYGLLAVSLFTILLITINRYIMIGHPRIYPRIYRHRYLGIMVAATWIGAFAILIPTYCGVWGTFGLDTDIGSCSILHDQNGNSPKEFLFIMAFVVPCFCIVVCYARIFYIVRKTALRSREPANSNSAIQICKQNIVQPENNNSDQQLIEKNSKPSKDENSEISSSVSHSGVSTSDKEQFKQKLPQPDMQTQKWQMRPFLSKVRDDEMKYIDTSVESDFPPSLSRLKFQEPRESSPGYDGDVEYLDDKGDAPPKGAARISNIKETEQHLISNGTVETIVTEVPLKTHDETGVAVRKSKRVGRSMRKTSFSRTRKIHNSSTVNTSSSSILYPGRMSVKDRRLLKMILVIFISFVICYLPITITKIWKNVALMHWLNISGYLLIYLTTCINPFIYVVMSSEYRQAYWNLLRCKATSRSAHVRRYTIVNKQACAMRLQT